MVDSRVWLIWATSVLVIASTTRNPLYIILLLLVALYVGQVHARDSERRQLLSPLRFVAVVVPFAAAFNALFVHFGDTVLFRLPEWIPVLGGCVTLEALVFGAINGLVLATIFSGFAVFNQATPARDLIRLTPRAFHGAGVVISIALSFLPQMTRSLQRIREAQMVRGHQLRGLRDWPPIVVPLLINGLERSMGLAEAMVARGYGAVVSRSQSLRTQVHVLVGLALVLGGWVFWLFVPDWRTGAAIALIAGIGLILGAVWLAGRDVQHAGFRSHKWTGVDTLALAGCALSLTLALVSTPPTDHTTLSYSPYPRLALPSFDSLIGLSLLGLLVPAISSSQSPK